MVRQITFQNNILIFTKSMIGTLISGPRGLTGPAGELGPPGVDVIKLFGCDFDQGILKAEVSLYS
jgi:hypothetical protein